MSYLLSPVSTKENFTVNSHGNSKKKHHRNILKHKEICYKRKCIRELRNKLKKYKLRHDGSEDQDILDVSQILIKSLSIKSPESQSNNKNNNCIFDENYPRNYLFKMGRRKQLVKCNQNLDSNRPFANHNDDVKSSLTLTESKEKQQTNAFKLLMDSRNKSIGSNSPGKEKVIDENEAQEIEEKKTLKAKRSLALQKMAEGKGSLKRKEMEEYQEVCIKKKMEKRAERLKNMITNITPTTYGEKQTNKESKVKSSKEIKSDLVSNSEGSKQKSLTLVSLFNDAEIQNSISPQKNLVSEDSEFLKKLSPSLKKKENMLCYFKKLEKEIPSPADTGNENCTIDDNVIIKVKLSSKLKKKAKKKKLSLSKVNSENLKSEDVSINNIEINSNDAVDILLSESTTAKDRRKRKRDGFVDDKILNDSNSKDIETPTAECRPKRNIKKPVKYSDDVDAFSSDDDLHIFTPKKKKQGDNKTPAKLITRLETTNRCKSTQEITIKSDVPLKTKSANKVNKKPDIVNDTQKVIVQKKNVKLAPIFAAKTQLDPAAIEAKQKFLHSGVPDKLKKIICDQKNKTIEEFIFPFTVHIQQMAYNKYYDTTEIPENYSGYLSDSELKFPVEDILCDSIFDILLDKTDTLVDNSLTIKSDKYTVLQNLKNSYPKFPVFRTYRLLKDKKCGVIKDLSYQDIDNSIEVIDDFSNIINESSDKLNWADRYKAASSKHIIGNFESIRELRKWLVTWTENEVKSKNKVSFESDSSDFCHSDSDSKDSVKTTNNLLLITGPVGSGKTSSVYAVAAELAIKVIEVNPSSKRTGKIMLQDLQEATQSHKVNRGKSSTENSQKSQELYESKKKPPNKRGRPKKNVEGPASKTSVTVTKNESLSQSQPINSQESTRTGMSLILIDDADIVFEQDDGFCSAIMQLVQSSKRPVILISSTPSCTHLQRFSQIGKNIIMRPFQPRMLGTWLDIMCLADSGVGVPGTGATILDFYKGDIRKAINSLHFYVSSQIQTENEKDSNTPSSDNSPIMEDENSSMSWVDNYNTEDKDLLMSSFDNKLSKLIIGQQLTLTQCHPLDLFNVWWSIPTLLISPIKFGHGKGQNIENNIAGNEQQTVFDIEAIANALDSISVADCFKTNKASVSKDITSDPWLSVESDSVSENEVLDDYNRDEELIKEISNRLVCGSIFETQNTLKINRNRDLQFPSMDLQRERDRVVSRHHNLSDSFSSSAALDRKALSLDYWSCCRTICRVERSKTDNNSKRNNRFCHYLKSLNVMCKLDYFDKLAESLQAHQSSEEQTLEIE